MCICIPKANYLYAHLQGEPLQLMKTIPYPAILTNTLVPQLGLSSILQNQLGVALDALTISPFLVIGNKLVEVFNGDKSM